MGCPLRVALAARGRSGQSFLPLTHTEAVTIAPPSSDRAQRICAALSSEVGPAVLQPATGSAPKSTIAAAMEQGLETNTDVPSKQGGNSQPATVGQRGRDRFLDPISAELVFG